MPKSKTSRKTSKSKKSKNSFLSKFSKLSSSKKNGALFVLAFALVGGFFVIKSFAATPHKILYSAYSTVSGKEGNYLYSINQDGSGVAKVVLTQAMSYSSGSSSNNTVFASASPSGDTFTAVNSCCSLYTANIDGSNVKIIKPVAGGSILNPRWNSSSRRISYVQAGTPGSQLRVVNSGGANDHLVTALDSAASQVVWVQGTEQLVVSNNKTGNADQAGQFLFVINSDGTGKKIIASFNNPKNTNNIISDPSVSKTTTKRVVFENSSSIYTVNVDGTGFKKVIAVGVGADNGSMRLGFTLQNWNENSFLYITTAPNSSGALVDRVWVSSFDGKTKKLLATSAKLINNVAWTSDGKGVVFDTVDRTSKYFKSINYVKSDGTGQKVLANAPANVSYGQLQPL